MFLVGCRWLATKPSCSNCRPMASGSGDVNSTNSKPFRPSGLMMSAMKPILSIMVGVTASAWHFGAGVILAAAMIDAILRQHHIGRHVALRLQFAIDRPEVHIGRFAQKILETVDDEIALLIIVDAILGPHQPLQIETAPVDRTSVVQGKSAT